MLGGALLYGLATMASGACTPTAAVYDLPAQPLDTTRQQFAPVSRYAVQVDTRLIGDRRKPALSGCDTPAEVLIPPGARFPGWKCMSMPGAIRSTRPIGR